MRPRNLLDYCTGSIVYLSAAIGSAMLWMRCGPISSAVRIDKGAERVPVQR